MSESTNVSVSLPLVSFIIAAFNEEQYIAECIDSCLNQTYQPIQVVATDDGSTDQTRSILEVKYKDEPRVITLSLASNQNKIAAFNMSFANATGDYIAIVGADDVNFPERIATQFKQLGDYALTMCNVRCYDENLSVVTKDRFVATARDTAHSFDELSVEPFGLGSILLKRDVANKIFPLPTDILHEDWYIPLLASQHGPILFTQAPLYKYRIHKRNTSGVHSSAADLSWEQLLERYTRDRYFFLRVAERLWESDCRNEAFYNLLNALVLFELRDERCDSEAFKEEYSLERVFSNLEEEFIEKNRELIGKRLYRLARISARMDRNDLSKRILRLLRVVSDKRYFRLRMFLSVNVKYSSITRHFGHVVRGMT